jgi:hypothetical protein
MTILLSHLIISVAFSDSSSELMVKSDAYMEVCRHHGFILICRCCLLYIDLTDTIYPRSIEHTKDHCMNLIVS